MKSKVRKRRPTLVEMEQVKKIDKSVVPAINIDMKCMMRNAAKKTVEDDREGRHLDASLIALDT